MPVDLCFAVDTAGGISASDMAQVRATIADVTLVLRSTTRNPKQMKIKAVTYAGDALTLELEKEGRRGGGGGNGNGVGNEGQSPPQPVASGKIQNVNIGSGLHACDVVLKDGKGNNNDNNNNAQQQQQQKWIVLIARHREASGSATMRSVTIARALQTDGIKVVVVAVGMNDAERSAAQAR